MTKECKQIIIPIMYVEKNARKRSKWSSVIQDGGHRVESCLKQQWCFVLQARTTKTLLFVGWSRC